MRDIPIQDIYVPVTENNQIIKVTINAPIDFLIKNSFKLVQNNNNKVDLTFSHYYNGILEVDTKLEIIISNNVDFIKNKKGYELLGIDENTFSKNFILLKL